MTPKMLILGRDGSAKFRTYYGGLVIDQAAIVCPECGGSGKLDYDEPVPDYQHGGYLSSMEGDCFHCDGFGYIPDPDDGEEA